MFKCLRPTKNSQIKHTHSKNRKNSCVKILAKQNVNKLTPLSSHCRLPDTNMYMTSLAQKPLHCRFNNQKHRCNYEHNDCIKVEIKELQTIFFYQNKNFILSIASSVRNLSVILFPLSTSRSSTWGKKINDVSQISGRINHIITCLPPITPKTTSFKTKTCMVAPPLPCCVCWAFKT